MPARPGCATLQGPQGPRHLYDYLNCTAREANWCWASRRSASAMKVSRAGACWLQDDGLGISASSVVIQARRRLFPAKSADHCRLNAIIESRNGEDSLIRRKCASLSSARRQEHCGRSRRLELGKDIRLLNYLRPRIARHARRRASARRQFAFAQGWKVLTASSPLLHPVIVFG